MGSDERRQKRLARRKKNVSANMIDSRDTDGIAQTSNANDVASSDSKIATLLSKNEDDLLKFVVKVNKVYQDKLNRPAPFMTFVICGMQSAGKSTIMERFMSAVLNIVQEGKTWNWVPLADHDWLIDSVNNIIHIFVLFPQVLVQDVLSIVQLCMTTP